MSEIVEKITTGTLGKHLTMILNYGKWEFRQDVSVDKDITISELIEKTRKRMGDADFSNYSARKNNCQDFMMNVLSANGLSSPIYTKFIKQDVESVFNNLPSYAEKISDVITGAQALVERQISGEGQYMHNYGLHRARCKM